MNKTINGNPTLTREDVSVILALIYEKQSGPCSPAYAQRLEEIARQLEAAWDQVILDTKPEGWSLTPSMG